MNVVDASTCVEGLLDTGAARELLHTGGLHVPHLVDAEVCSAIRRHASAGTITDPQGEVALAAWQRLAITRHPVVALVGRVWELRHNLSAYDACYVALAEALDCPLITTDGRLARAAGPRCPITVLPG